MNLSVGLMEGRDSVDLELLGIFTDRSGHIYPAGRHRFVSPIELTPTDEGSHAGFAIDDITIGIGFHWERKERQVFHGGVRILQREGLTVINDVSLEEYVTSVISSEMSASCPIELLKAHAVISRSWLAFPKFNPESIGPGNVTLHRGNEIIRWYGREAHRDFDVCADDHCQRYQGVTKAHSQVVAQAVRATEGEMLKYAGKVCDARFSKCCGGLTEEYRTAWDDRHVPYLVSVPDTDETGHVYCDTQDRELLDEILPGFDQETRDFYRWVVRYSGEDIRELVRARLGEDLGTVVELEPLQIGPSGRIITLRIKGEFKSLVIGKELEIRRALSRSHLYSSAFEVERNGSDFVLRGKGWGHGVGLCQIGAAVMASRGKSYREILRHYYPGTQREGDGKGSGALKVKNEK
jgi:SpoIID/LytB domain protein